MVENVTVWVTVLLLHDGLAPWIRVPHLIHCIAFAFECAFTEIKRNEIGGSVTYESVAHREYLCTSLVALEENVGTEGLLSVIGSIVDAEMSGTAFHPHELPVEIEVEVGDSPGLNAVFGYLH